MLQSWPDICRVLGVSPSQSVCCGRWLTLHWLVTETRNGCSHLRAVFRFLSRWHRWEDVLWKCRWGWKLNHSVMLVQSGWRSQSLVAFEGQLREVKSSLYVCCSYWMNVTTGCYMLSNDTNCNQALPLSKKAHPWMYILFEKRTASQLQMHNRGSIYNRILITYIAVYLIPGSYPWEG